MGVDAGDVDNDGDEDIFITHLMGETNTLYINDGTGLFEDRTSEFGLAVASAPYTAFGTAWLDYDNDGWLDLLALNGAVRILERLAAAGDPYPLHQPNQLFHNQGGGRFHDSTAAAGPVLALSEVSRGAAFADIDNDGDTDVVLFNNNGPARLLRNEVGNRRTWLGLELLDAAGRGPALGTWVELSLDDGTRLWRRARRDGSYCSSNDPRVLFGLGEAKAVKEVAVHWPDGTREVWHSPQTGRYTQLRRGWTKSEDGK